MSESKVITAVLKDKQVHHLLQNDVGKLLVTHGDVWQFIKEYYISNDTVPPMTLIADRFPDFIVESNVGATKYHLDELRAEYVDRELRSIIRTGATLVQEGHQQQAIQELSAGLRELSLNANALKDVDAVDTDSAVAYMQKLIDNQGLASGVRIGIKGFDMCFPAGIRGGQFGVVLAFPSVGKSYFTLYMAAQAWLQGYTPLIVSLEMDENEVRNRLYAILGRGRWSLKRLDSGKVDIEEFKKWHENTFKGKQPFHIISTETSDGEVTPEFIRAKINQYRPDMVVADYMQLMTPNGGGDGEVVRMKNLSRELKLLAMSEKIPVIAISSATPTDSSDLTEPPSLMQAAWSRQISYDANWIIAMGRDLTSDVIAVVGRKNREGMLPDFLLDVDFDMGVFNYREWDDV
jgi:replicative DNA helicase